MKRILELICKYLGSKRILEKRGRKEMSKVENKTSEKDQVDAEKELEDWEVKKPCDSCPFNPCYNNI